MKMTINEYQKKAMRTANNDLTRLTSSRKRYLRRSLLCKMILEKK